ncbi:MAG: ABC transporter substrate-binding protein [Chloroflexota bacterium]|nr:ABC transporter substrate-binding protein [Chloroflexota bacterium]
MTFGRIRHFARLLALPLVVSLVAACTQTPSASNAPSATASGPAGTLTIAMRGDIQSPHPYLSYDIVGISYRENVFDALVEWGYDGKIVPGLAESWKVDGTTITFSIRKGVKFHNGDALTADDVKFSLDTIKSKDLNSGSATNFAAVDSATVVDPNTVQFKLSRIDARIFDTIANNLSILPAKYYASVGQAGFIAKPIGTGPFKFVSWAKDDRVTMEANTDYWAGSYKGKPLAKTLVFRAIPTAATRVAELKAGSADIVQDLPPDQVDPIKAAGFNVVENKSPIYNWAFFNTASTSDAAKPLKDAKVRQAMNMAVDTATIIKTVLGGHARQLAGGITDLTDGYTADLKPFAFDQAKAKSLLTEAGYPNGFSIDADISNTAKPDVAQAVIAQLGQVGIKVNLNALPTDVFNDRWIKKGLDPLYFVTWNTFTHPALLDLLAGCKGFISSFCNQDAQKFLDQGGTTLDQATQTTAYTQAAKVLATDPFGIYIDADNALYGVNSKVSGWKAHGITVVLGTNTTAAK